MPAVDRTSDEDLLRTARAALASADADRARRCAAVLWGRHEARIRLRAAHKAGRNRVDEVVSALGERFTQFVYVGTFEPDSVVAVLMRMTDWAAADAMRAEARRGVPSAWPELDGADDGDLVALLDRDERDRLLSVLDERERRVLLAVADGLSAEDACADLDLSVSNLYVIRHRARAKLRAAREARGG